MRNEEGGMRNEEWGMRNEEWGMRNKNRVRRFEIYELHINNKKEVTRLGNLKDL